MQHSPVHLTHLFAIFDPNTARPPIGLELLHQHFLDHSRDQEIREKCQRCVDMAFDHYAPGTRHKHVEKGCGFSYEVSPYCHFATRDGISALFAGEVGEWPGVNIVESAHNAYVRGDEGRDDALWLLDFYDTFSDMAVDDDLKEAALSALSKIEGQYAFVIFDSIARRVLAARDRQGSQPLYWGSTEDGRFMFGSSYDDLSECNPSATPFPAGSLYASERHLLAESPGDKGWVIPASEMWPGQLLSFMEGRLPGRKWRDVKAIPRVTSKGYVCGAVYKVASELNLANAQPAHSFAVDITG
jgi:hypothetical protein